MNGMRESVEATNLHAQYMLDLESARTSKLKAKIDHEDFR